MGKIELLAEYTIVFGIVDLELDVGWDAGFAPRQRAPPVRVAERNGKALL